MKYANLPGGRGYAHMLVRDKVDLDGGGWAAITWCGHSIQSCEGGEMVEDVQAPMATCTSCESTYRNVTPLPED